MTEFPIFGAILAMAAALCSAVPSAKAQAPQSWPNLTLQDLALKDNLLNPGEPALILYYEVQTDSVKSTETAYKRIKVFREDGKKYADVEIPYFETRTQVEEIRARVTSPEGRSEEFNGAIYDKEVVKMKKYRISAKAFTLPNVAVGSIIEYSYRLHWRSDIPDVFRNPGSYLITQAFAYPAAEWEIQQALSVRQGHFVLHPLKGTRTVTFTHELPKDAVQRTLSDATAELAVMTIPPFQKEEYSPPEESLKIRADVFYILGMFSGDTRYYWIGLDRREAEYYDAFDGKRKGVKKEVDGRSEERRVGKE